MQEAPRSGSQKNTDSDADAAIRAIYAETMQEALPEGLRALVTRLQYQGTKPAKAGYPCCRLETSCPSSSS